MNEVSKVGKKRRTRDGARKKDGGQPAVLSVCLTPEARAALDVEATAAGKSVAQLTEQVLIEGLGARRRRRNDPTQAITHAIAELAELVCTASAKPSEAAWRHGPSLFKALRIAVSQFMAKPEPPGHMVQPVGIDALGDAGSFGSLASPKNRAAHAVAAFWHNLHSAAREVAATKYALNLSELTNAENDPVYQALEIANSNRQYDFLRSIIIAALDTQRPFLSENIIRALNYHAIACLHADAGHYRQCEANVRGGLRPPESYRIPELMEDFVDTVNRNWKESDPLVLAAFVLWRLSNIHPFINGNGRTARAASYFVLCVKAGGWIKGEPILPELLKRNYDEYIHSLQLADALRRTGRPDLEPLHTLLTRLLNEQIASVSDADDDESGDPISLEHVR